MQKIGAVDLYSSLLKTKILQGIKDKPLELREDQIQIGSASVYTSTSATALFFVDNFPQEISFMLMSILRDKIETSDGKIKLNFQIDGEPHIINFQSSNMKAQQALWNSELKKREDSGELLKDASEYEIRNREDWLISSWKYFYDLKEISHSVILCNFIIMVVASDTLPGTLKLLRHQCRELVMYCAKHDIMLKRVTDYTYEFMEYAAPFGDKDISDAKGKKASTAARLVQKRLLSDLIISQMGTTMAGPVKSLGIPIGLDIVTGSVRYLNFIKKTADAENILIAGITGSGKTALIRSIAAFALANNFVFVVLDRQGDYQKYCEAIHGTVINTSSGDGLYLDNSVIQRLTGIQEIDATLYAEAMDATSDIFSVLASIGNSNGMTAEQAKVFNDAYNNCLNRLGVLKNAPSTWELSEGMSYHAIYREIKHLSEQSEYQQRYGALLIEFVDSLALYFEPDGLYSSMFQKKLSIQEVLYNNETPFIDIVMQLKNTQTTTALSKISDTIKQIMAAHILIAVTNHYRSLDMFTMQDIEEYQEYEASDLIQQTINVLVTGNRKRNAIAFILTNVVKGIYASTTTTGLAITANMTSALFGELDSDSIKAVCTLQGMENCGPALERIASDKNLKHCFLAKLDKEDIAIIKQVIPEDLVASDFFKSRSTEMNEENVRKVFSNGNRRQSP